MRKLITFLNYDILRNNQGIVFAGNVLNTFYQETRNRR